MPISLGQTQPFSTYSGNLYATTRNLSTVYQNTTNKPILVVASDNSSSGSSITAGLDLVDASTIVVAGPVVNGGKGFISFVVPPGYYYKILCAEALNFWLEFT